MTKQSVNIAIIQSTCVADKEKNISNTIDKIKTAAAKGAQIICLQELFASLYFCDVEDHENFKLAESIPGSTSDALQKLSKELGIVIIASLFERRAAGLYHNTTAVIDADGSFLGIYRKNHIPDDPGFYEKFYFTPGDTGYKCFDTKFGKLGVLICWDQWYPEAARLTALKGAQILFYPTAIGWELTTDENVNSEQYHAWQTIQRAHAIANGVHVVSVNRVGTEGPTRFWGGSFICNPMGSILHQSPFDKEEIHIQPIHLDETEKYRTIWPFLRDRRIDTYHDILKRFDD